MEKINIDKLCIDKTFKDFMESLRDEVDRRLNGGEKHIRGRLCDNIPVTISLQAQWSEGHGFPIDTQTSCMTWVVVNFGPTNFSITESEFKRTMGNKKALSSLANVRFIDALWSIESLREMQFEVLRRFDPEWETPDDYLH